MEGKIPYSRLVEIATLAIDGLLKDDREAAFEYFSKVVELTPEELEFFLGE